MGIPKKFNQIIQKHLHAHAAWLPITNIYRLGDYGIIAEGVFNRMGNVQDEFNLSFKEARGPEAKIDFVSSNTTVVRTVAGAEVDVIPQGAVGAKLTYKFQEATSFLVKAGTIRVAAIDNVNQVANQLKQIREWDSKWRVVWQTYYAEDAAILSTMAAGTEVSFSGDTKALQQLDIGSISAGFEVSVNKELGLRVLGKAGIIALGLFKMKWLIGGINILDKTEAKNQAQAEFHTNWEADPDDDV